MYEYEERFIHAKTMVCDNDVGIIGTANLDNRSFRLNFEVVAVIYGDEVNTVLANAFTHDLTGSRELKQQQIDALKLSARFGQGLARLISPLL